MYPLILGAIVGAVSQSIATAVQVKQSKKAAKRNREFQREMRDTAMQSKVKDLKAAGLNPILAAGGPGAAQPGGATAQIPDIGGSSAKGAANALNALLGKSQLKTEKYARREALTRMVLNEQLAHKAHSAKNLQDAQWGIVHSGQAAADAEESVYKNLPQAKWLSVLRGAMRGR